MSEFDYDTKYNTQFSNLNNSYLLPSKLHPLFECNTTTKYMVKNKNTNDSTNSQSKNSTLDNSYYLENVDKPIAIQSDGNYNYIPKSNSIFNQIRDHFRQFCLSTSLRGVPRIVNSVDLKRRMLWLIFVIVFFVGCITCLTFIIKQYLEFDVIHQPKKLYDKPSPFPSVTLCNLRPFSTRDIRKLKAAGVLPVDRYLELIKRLVIQMPIDQRRLWTMLWNFPSYLSNLPKDFNANDLGHSLEDIVKTCFIVYKTGSMTRGTVCERSGYWTKTQDPVFHNCYTYTVHPNRTKQALNMELVIYLDNLIEHTDCFDCQERLMASQLTGARLLLHPGASYPLVAEEGINLMPGTMTDIRFNVYEWSMMQPPHGRCDTNSPQFVTLNQVNYSFSEEACRFQHEQLVVAKNCHCLTQYLPTPNELSRQNLQKCQTFNLPATYQTLNNLNHSKAIYFNKQAIKNFTQSSSCAESIGIQMEESQIDCRPACVRYTYKPSITAAKWPTKTFLTWFVNKFLRDLENVEKQHFKTTDNQTYQLRYERFDELRTLLEPYKQISNLTKKGLMDEAIEMLMQTQIFEQNFLSIIISRPNFDLERVEEKAVVSMASLFSQIGGLLSIWVGMTFAIIVELLELLINVYDTFVAKQTKK